MRIGHGYDVHQLVSGRDLTIGGVKIPHAKGLLGHSDADVLLHAICDACLGAAGLGDIGRHFPDTESKYKDVDSRILLRQVGQQLKSNGYCVGNIDSTIVAQAPRLASYVDQMAQNIAADLHTSRESVNVKAKTTERLGFIGREEGIAAYAVVLLERINVVS